MTQHTSDLTQASWIWLAQEERIPHQYVCFRRTIDLNENIDNAVAEISVDSDFILWINGTEIGRGQFSDYPQSKTYTRYEVADSLKQGANTICIFAYYRGEDFSEHRAGEPGLIFSLRAGDTLLVSDGTWKAVQHPAFTSGSMPRVTGQMGFTACFDARKDIDWTNPAFDDSSWSEAEVIATATSGFWQELTPRPVPPLKTGENTTVSVVVTGDVIRTGEGESIAETVSSDFLLARSSEAVLDGSEPVELPAPAEGVSGAFLITDVGCEEVGLLTFTVEAPEGTVLDIAHGEHLTDGRVRARLGGRNFADRYICREGMNTFTLPFRRLGARYIEMHITSASDIVKVHYLGMKPVWLDAPRIGSFASDDPMAAGMYEVGVRTLELCMHEHYEDCPWREQSLYAYDSRNQALYGYYAFGNYDFAHASFDLLGCGLREDGLLELCAPARVRVTIPTFTHVWITCVAEQWLYSGDDSLFRKHEGTIRTVLETSLGRLDSQTGLYRMPSGQGIWHFYEWTENLGGELGADSENEIHHALYNLYLHESLESYAWMLRQTGNDEDAAEMEKAKKALGKAIHGAFWNDGKGRYATWNKGGSLEKCHDAVQVLALERGVVPTGRTESVMDALYAEDMPPMTLSSIFYLFKALMRVDATSRKFVAHNLAKFWEPMMRVGATSFWEARYGDVEFGYAGSLCHGWSAVPVYFYQAEVLGIKPLTPGFRDFQICVYPDRLSNVSGDVVTPAGPVSVEWWKRDDGLHIDVNGPETLSPVVRQYPEAPVAEVRYNGVELAVTE